jgi:hypothetical protein
MAITLKNQIIPSLVQRQRFGEMRQIGALDGHAKQQHHVSRLLQKQVQ